MNLCKLNTFFHTLAGLLLKSVQLAEVHLYRIYFLQNPYFSENGHFVNLLSFASSYFFINHMIQQPKAWRHVDHLKWPWKLTRGSNDKAFFIYKVSAILQKVLWIHFVNVAIIKSLTNMQKRSGQNWPLWGVLAT